jgi:hypothetical protein
MLRGELHGLRMFQLTSLPSADYGFTFDLPTNEARCIDRFWGLRDTARALRDGIKKSGAKD